jgi:hypothetical protein
MGIDCLNFDRELGNLRDAEINLRRVAAGPGPELYAYIEALKLLNAEMSGGLDPFMRRLSQARLAQRRACQSVSANGAETAAQARVANR